jgi:putative nucleotidyltransferase with HDIG domain
MEASAAVLTEPAYPIRVPAQVRVLVVDDDPAVRDVLHSLLAEEGYDVVLAGSADAALAAVREHEPEIVLSDMKMPGHDGLWLLDSLLREHPNLGVIMLTGFGDAETAVDCLRRGAVDYLTKPPRVLDLVRSIERAIGRRRSAIERYRYHIELERQVREKTAELTQALGDVAQAYTSTLSALVAALDAREQETSDHSQRVVRFALAIAARLGLKSPELDDVGRGALLHDIGKIGVTDAILLKAGPLTPAEWIQMRRHPEIGATILSGIPFLAAAGEIVLSHQERWDGNGYPRRLRGEEIPLGARIFAVADTLDAIVSDRPYRRGASFDDARKEISRCSGTQFDPRVVEAFLALDANMIRALHRGESRPEERYLTPAASTRVPRRAG